MIDGYIPLVPRIDFLIEAVFSVHYFEYSSSYLFPGECHGFWEFCYVDKGELDITADDRKIHLQKSQIIFHKPNEFHDLRANGTVAPNLVVASFACNSAEMEWFENRVLTITDKGRAMLASLIDEANYAFSSVLDDPYNNTLVRREKAAVGAEQLIKILLESLLIELAREGQQLKSSPERAPSNLIRDRSQQETVDRVVCYLENNVSQKLTLVDVCKANLVGRSYLQKVFRERTGGGVMEYFGKLKVEAAKRMIREGKRNFTEIAAKLGYNSIHYFSRHFKKITGMTPSEYTSSIKALSVRSDS